MRMRTSLLVLSCATLLAGCLGSPFETAAGGSGTEGENGGALSGMVRHADGSPAEGVAVSLRSSDYLRDTAQGTPAPEPDAITDASGAFRIPVRPGGKLTMVFRDGKGMAAMRAFSADRPGEILLTPDTLRPTGSLSGSLGHPEGHIGRAYVQVYGTDLLVRADSSGDFRISDLPAGIHRVQVVSPWSGWSYPPSDTARIAPSDSTRLPHIAPVEFLLEDYSSWPHSLRIGVNTAKAGIQEGARDFPLLVRLDSTRFGFAGSDGRDIRFSDAAGRKLRYQREVWDAGRKTAAVWVKLDTVLGNDSLQSITLHWGKTQAADFSDGQAVFSTFAGAWHLSDSVPASGQGMASDASPFRHHGVARLVTGGNQGFAGREAVFDQVRNTSVRAAAGPALMPTRYLTLSGWVRLAGHGIWGGILASMGDNYTLWVDDRGRASFSIYTDSIYDPDHDPWVNPWTVCKATGPDLRDSLWHLVTATYDGATMRVYVDGFPRGSREVGRPLTYLFGKDFRIGMHGAGSPNFEFSGGLDEVQVSAVTRSPDWIRLAFENQRQASDLLEFRNRRP